VSEPQASAGSSDWLNGHAAAMVLSFDMDAESCVLSEGERYASHIGPLSHQAYGPRVGVPRILELLDEFAVRSTFFVPGRSADVWPGVVEQIVERGHEVAAHSWAHKRLCDLTEPEERADFERSLESLGRLGITPAGHRSPMAVPSPRTASLVAEYGFSYQSTLMDDDRPYLLQTSKGLLAELPISWILDDFPQYAFLPDPLLGQFVESPVKALEVWQLELEEMRRYGGLFMLVNHPFLSGRASRVDTLRRLIGRALELGDVLVATAGETAERVRLDQSLPTRPEPKGFDS